MAALALHIFRVHEPDLLSQIEPFRPRKLVGALHAGIELRRLSRLHIDVDEFDRVVLDEVARIRVAPEHHFRCLLLPDEEAVSLQVRLGEDPILDIEGDVFQVARVLMDNIFWNWHDGSVYAQLAVRPQHSRAVSPDALHVLQICFVGGPQIRRLMILDSRPIRRRRNDQIDATVGKMREHLGGMAGEEPVCDLGGATAGRVLIALFLAAGMRDPMWDVGSQTQPHDDTAVSESVQHNMIMQAGISPSRPAVSEI